MSIDSCSSSSTSNLATQYAEQLASTRQDRLHSAKPDPNDPTQPGAQAQVGGTPRNGLGDHIGTLVNTTA